MNLLPKHQGRARLLALSLVAIGAMQPLYSPAPSAIASGWIGTTKISPQANPSCHTHASYPDICFFLTPPAGNTVNCEKIGGNRFVVLSPDTYRFDGDRDGIGCEG